MAVERGGGFQMRNRKIQRALKKLDAGMISMKDNCGMVNPTQYYAVKDMIDEQKQLLIKQMRSVAENDHRWEEWEKKRTMVSA